MSRFALIKDTTNSPELEALYQEIVSSRFGTEVPLNWFTAQGSHPDLSQIPQPHRAILQCALKAAREPNALTDEDFCQLRANDLNDDEIMEVAMMAAFMNFINTWVDVSDVMVDGEE